VVLSGNLGAGEAEIMIYHLEGNMSENLTEREDIAAIYQVINSKCMTA